MVPEILEGLGFLHSGATSNLWGLGCPLYCTQPTVGFPLASFLTGIISGFGLGIWIAYLVLTRFTTWSRSCARSTRLPEPQTKGAAFAWKGTVHE